MQLNITHNGDVLHQVDSTTFLGVTIDKHCNWKNHIKNLCSRLDRYVYVLHRLRCVATTQAALSAYHGYVSSLLRYGLIMWGNSVDSERVFKVQKKCIRALCGEHFLAPCRPLFKKCNFLPLPSLYIYEICLFVRRNHTLFSLNSEIVGRDRQQRHKHKLLVPEQRVRVYSNNVYCMAITVYNKLPESFKIINYNSLERNLFDFLMGKCYYNVDEFLKDKLSDVHFKQTNKNVFKS